MYNRAITVVSSGLSGEPPHMATLLVIGANSLIIHTVVSCQKPEARNEKQTLKKYLYTRFTINFLKKLA